MKASRVLIIGSSPQVFALRGQLLDKGFACSVAYDNGEVFRHISEQSPDIVLLEFNSRMPVNQDLPGTIKREKSLPVIALLHQDALKNGGLDSNVDDFIIEPFSDTELVLRIERLLKNSSARTEVNPDEIVTAGDLVIDTAKCEVSIGGRIVLLAFKEYELLKFLVGNRGRVFTRQVLLDKVWGIDYFGGDRTVDVHIRRLRSKIEDSKHSFIETIRSIGYRFKEDI
jgi:two-component system alkaline phosphatase synthesis response regulator PhoP